MSNNKYKYIHEIGGHYSISKQLNGKMVYFGTYTTIEDALTAREELQENNWVCQPRTKKLRITKRSRGISRYITPTQNNKYAIYKQLPSTGKGATYFGTFNSLDEAIKYRDYLEENNWNTELIKFSYKKTDKSTRYISIVKNKRKDGSVTTKYKIFHSGVYLGTFNTLKEAIFERDLLESVDWDYDALMELPVECWSEDSI